MQPPLLVGLPRRVCVSCAPLELLAPLLMLLALARVLHVLWAVLPMRRVCLPASYVLLALILLVWVGQFVQLLVVQEATAP